MGGKFEGKSESAGGITAGRTVLEDEAIGELVAVGESTWVEEGAAAAVSLSLSILIMAGPGASTMVCFCFFGIGAIFSVSSSALHLPFDGFAPKYYDIVRNKI